MTDKLAVHFHARREHKTQICYEVNEGDNGIYLFDDHSQQVGYIPYDSLTFVEPISE